MPTAYEDQFFTIDPGVPPAVGTPLVFQRVEFIDEDDDGNIETGTGDTFNGFTITNVWQNDTVTIELPGGAQITYVGVTFYLGGGQPAVFTPTDGQVLQNGTFVSSTFVTNATQTPVTDFGPTCFTPGTRIETPEGLRLIEDLCAGDLVCTLDNGAQPIVHIVDAQFRAARQFAPIRFAKGAIGNDAPLTVSPQHRILFSGWRAELYFGEDEVLVAAKSLVNGDSIRRVTGGSVRYIHLLFDGHQIIFGQGVPSESYYPGHGVERHASAAQREFDLFFPSFRFGSDAGSQMARPALGRFEAALLEA